MKLPIVDSEYLFRLLTSEFGVDLICDVGAFDCAHARLFRKGGARVAAIEANPVNFATMALDPRIAADGIEIFNCAMWNTDGTIAFNVIDVIQRRDGARVRRLNPIGSVRARTPNFEHESEPVMVRSARLDSFIQRDLGADRVVVALWIDVEGAAYEVLQGMENVRAAVCIANVEVETEEFWQDQHLWPAVASLMRDFDFKPIARRAGDRQFDVLFINNRWLNRAPMRVHWCVVKAWLRWRVLRVRRRFRA